MVKLEINCSNQLKCTISRDGVIQPGNVCQIIKQLEPKKATNS